MIDRLGRWMFKIYELTWRLMAARRTVILPPPVRDGGPPPIFVIGCPRSGTTLLRMILDSHPKIACPPETFFLLDLESFWNSNDAIKGLAEMGYDREHVRSRLRQFAGYFLQGYAESRGKVRVAEKTPHYVACLDFIEELFKGQTSYVMLYRHPLDVILSMGSHFTIDWHPLLHRYVEREDDKLEGYAHFWADHTAKMLDFESRHTERCFHIHYEALVRDTEGTLRNMFEFLGEPWAPEVLSYHEAQHDVGRGDRKALFQKGIKPSVGHWQALDEPTRIRLWEIVEPVASQLGYSNQLEVRRSTAGRQPSAITRAPAVAGSH